MRDIFLYATFETKSPVKNSSSLFGPPQYYNITLMIPGGMFVFGYKCLLRIGKEQITK